ncbi:TrgA family protein [Donghicola sp. C2-DW-16]|uniref:TrgA family protein n=1 Tax=Donghicola mangrovi TaxID=2729614 RepID=A0A850Q0I7_9RHOB|nr:TrgA family protein [Donghicola mangrovi]NVO23057.1 TrgA family protein [Donghicola mangrovi]NVO28437.1 TrgA family protein [Donghicola mangrovi]
MPTAARLIAAIFMALTGVILALKLREVRPALQYYQFFIEYNMFLGAVIGWQLVGPRVGNGWARAAVAGINGGFVTVLLVFMSLATREMLIRAFRKLYDHALEAVLAAVKIGISDFMAIAVTMTIAPVFMGAVLSGLGAEAAHRRWR